LNVETAEDISCQELVELVTEYLEGAMSPEERARFEEHAATCRGCKAYLVQMHETIRLVGRLQPADLSPEAEQALLQAFRSWRSG
jgi:anti-sigma factor RsiW